MALVLGQTWADAMVAICDPVFAAADVGFVRQVMRDADGDAVSALLWEADPAEFAERYPGSEIIESYGDQWPAPCIDYWMYLDPVAQEARLSVEGWNLWDEVVPLTGDGNSDGLAVGASMVRILRVPAPGT